MNFYFIKATGKKDVVSCTIVMIMAFYIIIEWLICGFSLTLVNMNRVAILCTKFPNIVCHNLLPLFSVYVILFPPVIICEVKSSEVDVINRA